jgi:hypothetical protein
MADSEFARRAAHEAHVSEAYRSIGHYVYRFSQLVQQMKLFAQRAGGDSPAIHLAAGESSAYQVCNWFFAVCFNLGTLTDEEKKVGKNLRLRVHAAITYRNDMLHGDWFIGFADEETILDPTFTRMKPASETSLRSETISAADLDLKAKDLHGLAKWVVEFANLARVPNASFPGIKTTVSDLFTVHGKEVRRNGAQSGTVGQPMF